MQDSVYDKFVGLLTEKVKSTPIGDGFDERVTCGPIVSGGYAPRSAVSYTRPRQISKVQFDKVWGYIESGKQEGAKVLVGGDRRAGKGYFVNATGKTLCPNSDNRGLLTR